ncbi:putative hydrolase YxeP [Pigmentiphaga humi]|uniref:Putative hydrolase YxeP n=1 Tax=Pigmentiphaga humi TaxID=2478468 RepID=A0A3P4B550_9BURK|nr:M20 aminoacylase family protein [Pigmentiphaga humi]VCU71172.1 putative hydrolase YxeP [Pigmentiphaga humi]
MNLEVPDTHAHDMTTWRRAIHRNPELGFEEYETAAFVAERLREWGIETHTGIGGTGVVGVIRGTLGAGRNVGLRADMDALPMQEQTGLPYQSAKANLFHGCGHDGHTAILLGVARHYASHRDFRGTLHLIFQPAEETLKGGSAMIRDGLFERFPCDEVYGLHNHPPLEPGRVGVRNGAILSACDLFRIRIHGVGGHAASPHRAIDPIMIGSALIQSMQSIVSRSVDPLQTAVVSICQFHAGTAINIIADHAVLEGTVRTLDHGVQTDVLKRLREICAGAEQAYRCRIEFEHLQTSPATINTAEQAQVVRDAARAVLGEAGLDPDIAPLMASEDFAYMLQEKPGCYFFLGNGGHMCHHPKFDFNDKVLPVGMSVMVEITRRRLA